MSKQVQEAYIVAATRTPVGKAPSLDPASVGDVIVGCVTIGDVPRFFRNMR